MARVGDDHLVELRRDQIVAAAIALVTRQGFAKTVVRQIADEAGMSVGSVYEYVRRKEDVLFLIMEHGSRAWREGLGSVLAGDRPPLLRLRNAVEFLVDSADANPDQILIWYRESGNLGPDGLAMAKKAERELIDLLATTVEEATADGCLTAGSDPHFLATMLIASSHTWVLKAYLLHSTMTRQQFAQSLVTSFLAAAASPKGRRLLERP